MSFYGSGWSEERVETLKKLWCEGYSASQIAGRLGGCTRNAVIGKVNRLGLSNRKTVLRKKAVLRRQRARRFWLPQFDRMTRNANLLARLKTEPLPAPCETDVGRIHISEVSDKHCKFIPLEDGMCCGLEAVPGFSWCRGHLARVYPGLAPVLREAAIAEPETVKEFA